MNDTQLLEIWKSYDLKLNESLRLNKQQASDILQLKVRSHLLSMQPIKLFALAIGILWVLGGLLFIVPIYVNAFSDANKFFLFAISFQMLVTGLAIGFYLYQIHLIHSVDVSQSILRTQEKIARLQTNTLWITKILFLQLPAWTVFWWNETMFATWNVYQWAIVLLITGLFIYVSIWLFINLRIENQHKRWFQVLLGGKEWTPLQKSMDILNQVDDLKSGLK